MGMRTVEENQDIHNVEDAVYEEVTEQLANEKEANANKTNIGFDQASEDGGKGAKTVVDMKTGEIKQEQPGNATEEASKNDHPDF